MLIGAQKANDQLSIVLAGTSPPVAGRQQDNTRTLARVGTRSFTRTKPVLARHNPVKDELYVM
jgi:hypothetical protein